MDSVVVKSIACTIFHRFQKQGKKSVNTHDSTLGVGDILIDSGLEIKFTDSLSMG